MKLNIQPITALCDHKLDFRISGLPPSGRVKTRASFRLPWAKDVLYESEAWFTADDKGAVDLSSQKPEEGGYDFIDSMGLITSARSRDPQAIKKIGHVDIDENLIIQVEASNAEEKQEVRLTRCFMDTAVKRLKITDGFVGELFYWEGANRRTIIFLGGSGSGLGVNAPLAAGLASRGFNVLSLPFHGEAGLPNQLSMIPLEYFERAFDWLAKNPITRCKDLWILGMSKGAEASLILASQNPAITRMVLWAPHAYCFNGIAFKNESSWSYEGTPIPYIRLKNRWLVKNMLDCMMKNKPFGYTSTYRKGLAMATNREAARIKVEKMNTDVMMFTSKDCNMWNTFDGCLEIMATLDENHYGHEYDLTVYEDAGEPYYIPYVIPAGETSAKLLPRLVLSTGGTLKGNAFARADSWEKTVEYFKKGE